MTEADVETQLLIPFLTAKEKLGLSLNDIKSKESIEARSIGKGAKSNPRYIPDFVVYLLSLPVMVIEVKRPDQRIGTAYDEARLYASEINSKFAEGVNPCKFVLATNGVDMWVGSWDSNPFICARLDDLNTGSVTLGGIVGRVARDRLLIHAEDINSKIRASDLKRPFNQSAGRVQINSKVEPNTFAADLSPVLRKYFSSRDQLSDSNIYEKAYISSNEVTGYDRILESFLKDRVARLQGQKQLKTTKKKADDFSKAISSFDPKVRTTGDIQLITGGVGAGKSLFARRYKEYLQPEFIKKKSHWAFLNFNDAPPSVDSWESWVLDTFMASYREENDALDLSDGDTQERVFASELRDKAAHYARLEGISKGRGELERARDLEQWRQDARLATIAIARYVQQVEGDVLVVVFDNVDRREADEQLRAFQAALWFMDQTKAFVILQMRDETFEAFKNEKPLDTYKTGQIFHISPPRFIDVVKKRLELALEDFSVVGNELVTFTTSKGASISYQKSKASEFLRGVYIELFQSHRNSARVLEALAGRNVRRALDMFMTLITSGHVPEEAILAVAQGNPMVLPEFRILRALMRQDYRFFHESSGFVANLLHADAQWSRPTSFITTEILFYILGRRRITGDNGQLGYVSLPRLLSEMEDFGILKEDAVGATHYLLKRELIEADSFTCDTIEETDCFKATAGGWAHLRILAERLEYLYAILPTSPMHDESFRGIVYDSMQIEMRTNFLSMNRQILLVQKLHSYLLSELAALQGFVGYGDGRPCGATYLIEKVKTALSHASKRDPKMGQQLDLLDR